MPVPPRRNGKEVACPSIVAACPSRFTTLLLGAIRYLELNADSMPDYVS
jgi:hypothetical protein